MKYRTDKEFELINLHDSRIEKIECDKNTIKLYLTFANLYSGHSANIHNEAACIKPCILIFHGVISTLAMVFSEENRIYEEHPEPDKPIKNEIMEASIKEIKDDETCFLLTGFHKAGWSKWEICSKSFELQWGEFSGDAWWVNWPSK
jgi:hypothetical protein